MPLQQTLRASTLIALLITGVLATSPVAFAATDAVASGDHGELDAEAGGTNDDYGITASDRDQDDSQVGGPSRQTGNRGAGGETAPRGEFDAEAGAGNDDYGLSASERDNDDPSFSDGAHSRTRQHPDDRSNVSVDSMSNRSDSLPNDSDMSQTER